MGSEPWRSNPNSSKKPSDTGWTSYDNTLTNPKAFQQAVQAAGYGLIIDAEDPVKTQEEAQHNYTWNPADHRIVPCCISGFLHRHVFMEYTPYRMISLFLTIPVVFWFGSNFLYRRLGNRYAMEKRINKSLRSYHH